MANNAKAYYQSRYYQQQKRYSKELAWAIAAQRRLEDFEKKKEE